MASVEAPNRSHPGARAYYQEGEDYRQSLLEFVKQAEKLVQQQAGVTAADEPPLSYPIYLPDYLKLGSSAEKVQLVHPK